jgi:hypothetical protein
MPIPVDIAVKPPNPSGYPATPSVEGNMFVRDPYGVGQYGILSVDTAIFVAGQEIFPGTGLQPSGDQTGFKDPANVQGMLNLVGYASLQAGQTYYFGGGPDVNMPPGSELEGHFAQVLYIGSGNAVNAHDLTAANYLGLPNATFRIRNVVFDGSFSKPGAIGVNIGDGAGIILDNVWVQHFNQTGSIGYYINNQNQGAEKSTVNAHAIDNTTQVVYDVQGGGSSYMYSSWEWHLYVNGGQNGVVVKKGNIQNQRKFAIYGNFFANSSNPAGMSVLDLSGNGSSNPDISDSFVIIVVETDTPTGSTWMPIRFGTNGSMINCTGLLSFLDAGAWLASDVTLGQFSFNGPIIGNGTAINNLVAKNQVTSNAIPAAAPASFNPADPTGTTSTTGLIMMGCGATAVYTPKSSGNVNVDVNGSVQNTTAGDGIQIGARYGPVAGPATTVAAGSNGIAANSFTGTQALDVASIANYAANGTIWVATSTTPAQITYSGVTGGATPSLNNCTYVQGGTGTLATGNAVTGYPQNGAPVVGTKFGAANAWGMGPYGAAVAAAWMQCDNLALTPGQQYWFDPTIQAVTGGTAKVGKITFRLQETS